MSEETDDLSILFEKDIIIKIEPPEDNSEYGGFQDIATRRANDYKIHPGEHLLGEMTIGKVFADNPTRVNCVDFSPDGMVMIASNADDSLSVYNLHTGLKDKNVCVNSKKYGVGLIRYGGNPNTAIHSSTKIDHNLRYLNLHDNKYLRYFTGHTEKVTCLQVAPNDDKVLSGSNDKTIRFWDLRTQHCQAVIDIPDGRPIATFDHTSEIFIVSSNPESMRFYDMRSLDKGPFAVYTYEKPDPKSEVVNLDVSRCGSYVLQNMNSGHIRIVDYMTGEQLRILDGHPNDRYEDMEASFSACGNFVFSGSCDSYIYGWNVKTGKNFAKLLSLHGGFIKVCRWNPRHCMLATACTKICLWGPDMFEFSNNPRKATMRIKPEISEEVMSEY